MTKNATSARFDFVLFGATGFTGQYAVEELARVAKREKISWAIAGRSVARLQEVLRRADTQRSNTGGDSLLQSVACLTADVADPASLRAMAKHARVLLNVVGPYRFYGEPVVEACIAEGTHHLDISGEPQFLEAVQLRHSAAAARNNVYVVGACGWDSVPAEMGCLFVERLFTSSGGELNTVEAFIDFNTGSSGAGINFGTWQSAVHGLANRAELVTLRRELFATQRLPKPEQRLPSRRAISFNKQLGKWCVPFPGSDRTVVMRSQRLRLGEAERRPVQFMTYLMRNSFVESLLLCLFGLMFGLLCSFKWGRQLLEQFPGFFSGGMVSKAGPSRSQVEEASFSMTFLGSGWTRRADNHGGKRPDRDVLACVTGPEPGYISTPICLIQAGLVLLREVDKLPGTGGVLTPGVAFKNTSLLRRLQDNRLVFTTIKA